MPQLIKTCRICSKKFLTWVYTDMCQDCQTEIVKAQNKAIEKIQKNIKKRMKKKV